MEGTTGRLGTGHRLPRSVLTEDLEVPLGRFGGVQQVAIGEPSSGEVCREPGLPLGRAAHPTAHLAQPLDGGVDRFEQVLGREAAGGGTVIDGSA